MFWGLRESEMFELSFAGPNVMTSTSTVPPGMGVQADHVRSNDKGVLTLALKDLRSVRLRLHQI
jgi:hypothetical protein